MLVHDAYIFHNLFFIGSGNRLVVVAVYVNLLLPSLHASINQIMVNGKLLMKPVFLRMYATIPSVHPLRRVF
jgi:hypothetical protein